jgi:multidrug resistance efflux pump
MLLSGVVLAIVGILAWGAVRVARTATASTAAETPTTKIKRGSVAITVAARGDIQGGNPEMLVAPQVAQDSLIVTTLRQPGEQVQAGDTVVEFDTTQQEYNLREAESDLAEADQMVIQTEADNAANDEETRYAVDAAQLQVTLAELEVSSNPVLAKAKARENEILLEAAKNRLHQAQQDLANKRTTGAASLAIQRAAQNKAKMLADMARKNIENMTLKSKGAGYVNLQTNTFGLRFLTTGMLLPVIQLGDNVRPGMAVAQLFDLEHWEASAKVSELDRGHLAVGQAVSVAVVALAGKSFPGHVKTLGNTSGEPWDRKFECRITLDHAGPDLRPGMSSNLVITAETLDNALWAPSQALFERDGRSFVYLRTPGGFTPRDVTLVKRSESQVVLTGVNEGDMVALSNPTEQSKPSPEKQSATKALSK